MFKRKKQKEEEPLFVLSKTNQQLLNYKAYKMEANEKMLYFLIAFIVTWVRTGGKPPSARP